MTLKSILFFCLSLFASWPYAAPQECGECGKLSGTITTEPGLVSAEQLQALQKNGHALVVDVRTESEWHTTGIIPGSQKLQAFNRDDPFDSSQWLADLQKLKSSPDQTVILVCRSGNRSGKMGEFLIRQGMPNVYHLNNGIQSWLKSGLPLQAD